MAHWVSVMTVDSLILDRFAGLNEFVPFWSMFLASSDDDDDEIFIMPCDISTQVIVFNRYLH